MRIATRSFKTFVSVGLIVLAILASFSMSEAFGDRHRHGRHGFGGPRISIGVGFGPAVVYPYPWWYSRPVYYYPAPVIVEEPPVYVQRQPAPPATAEAYWYYCASAEGYYPTVQSCPEAWIKVPPRSQ